MILWVVQNHRVPLTCPLFFIRKNHCCQIINTVILNNMLYPCYNCQMIFFASSSQRWQPFFWSTRFRHYQHICFFPNSSIHQFCYLLISSVASVRFTHNSLVKVWNVHLDIGNGYPNLWKARLSDLKNGLLIEFTSFYIFFYKSIICPTFKWKWAIVQLPALFENFLDFIQIF